MLSQSVSSVRPTRVFSCIGEDPAARAAPLRGGGGVRRREHSGRIGANSPNMQGDVICARATAWPPTIVSNRSWWFSAPPTANCMDGVRVRTRAVVEGIATTKSRAQAHGPMFLGKNVSGFARGESETGAANGRGWSGGGQRGVGVPLGHYR